MLGLVSVVQKVLSLPPKTICATLAGRAQGSCSCFSIPSISFLSQILETQAVQFPSTCTKILPTPLKDVTIPFPMHSKRRSLPALQVVNARVQEVQWEVQMHNALEKHQAGPVHQKELPPAVTTCSLWFPTDPLKHSGGMASTHSAVQLKWRWISNVPVSSVPCAPSYLGTS